MKESNSPELESQHKTYSSDSTILAKISCPPSKHTIPCQFNQKASDGGSLQPIENLQPSKSASSYRPWGPQNRVDTGASKLIATYLPIQHHISLRNTIHPPHLHFYSPLTILSSLPSFHLITSHSPCQPTMSSTPTPTPTTSIYITDTRQIASYNRGPITSLSALPATCTQTLTYVNKLYFGHYGSVFDQRCVVSGTKNAAQIAAGDAWGQYYCMFMRIFGLVMYWKQS